MQLGQARSLLCTALGGETAWNTLLHSHSHPRPPPSQAISFQTLGFEATRQKSRDCLVSGDRETQGTESIVTQVGKRFSAKICGCFLDLAGQG